MEIHRISRVPRCPRTLARYFFAAAVALLPPLAHAQSQSEIQYTYDGAGRVIGVTRTSTAKPDLTVSNLSVGTITAVGNGAFNIPVTFQVNNIGAATAVATWYDRGYLSANANLHDTDQVLAGYTTRSTNLAAGANYTVSTTYTTSTTTTPGNWYLIVKADGGAAPSGQFSPTGPNYVNEFNEFNNTQAVAVSVRDQRPDLTVSNFAVGAVTVNQSGSYNIPATFQVNNIGGTAANPTWYDLGYLSTNGVLDNNSLNLSGYNARSTALASGANYTAAPTYSTPTTQAPGSYTFFVKADGHGAALGLGTNTDNGNVVEANEANNTQSLSVTLPVKPDLTVTNASIGAITVSQNGSYSFPVTFTVNNIGGAAAQPNWFDLAYLSTNGVLDSNSVNLGGYNWQRTALTAGSSYTVTVTYSTSTTQASGAYTLFIKADGHGAALGLGTNTDNGNVVEANEANNTQALSFTLPNRPDLTVSNASVGAISVSQAGSYSFPVTFTVNNIGGAAAQPNWFDLAYLSTNGVLDSNSVNLGGYNWQRTALTAGSSYTVTVTYSTSTTQASGAYTLFIKADGHGAALGLGTNTDNGNVVEANEANNTQALSFTLPNRPDLTVSNLSVGTIIKNGNGSHSIPVSFQINNIGGSTALATWYDLAYLSTNGVLDNNSVNLNGYHTQSTSLAAGAYYTVNATYTTSTTQAAGSYTLFVKADGHGAALGLGTNTDNGNVSEANEANNLASKSVVLQ